MTASVSTRRSLDIELEIYPSSLFNYRDASLHMRQAVRLIRPKRSNISIKKHSVLSAKTPSTCSN